MIENSKRPNFNHLGLSFRQALFMDSYRLDLEWKKDPNKLSYGPQYHIKTSSSEHVDVSVLYFDDIYPDKRLRTYHLFGVNPQLGMVARKTSQIVFGEDSITAGGHLDTAYEGRGFGAALELVHADILK
jgi:hypothetical protein